MLKYGMNPLLAKSHLKSDAQALTAWWRERAVSQRSADADGVPQSTGRAFGVASVQANSINVLIAVRAMVVLAMEAVWGMGGLRLMVPPLSVRWLY